MHKIFSKIIQNFLAQELPIAVVKKPKNVQGPNQAKISAEGNEDTLQLTFLIDIFFKACNHVESIGSLFGLC